MDLVFIFAISFIAKAYYLLYNIFMTSQTQERANELLQQYAAGRFPVPVIEIANRLGIKVLAHPSYPNDGNGHIEVDAGGNPTIIVNDKQSPVRKRFTVAHEIAHWLFDEDYLKAHGSIDRDGNAADQTYRDRERRANDFAAQLLMPESTFIEQWLALPSVEKVADYFSVSKDAASYRAINIGLRSA
jgi:Zn-dependent peptidase ImmA (M78 family)